MLFDKKDAKILLMKPKVKICCIGSLQEAMDAIRLGAAALGLVGAMPSGPGVISDEMIKDIARLVPPPIATFLLTSETAGTNIIAHHSKVHTNTIQIVDYPEPSAYAQIRTALPAIKIVQVVHVESEASVAFAIRIASEVDAILLDSGSPSTTTKTLGGTGKVHDWTLSKRIRESTHKPIFLAGGLHAGNVREAIEVVQPYGLDLCSGVRTNGALDLLKLEQFFEAIEKV